MTTDIHLALARSGRLMAHVLDPPGLGRCYADRPSLDADLPDAVEAHLRWIDATGERAATPSSAEISVVEEVDVRGDFESGDDVGTFVTDLEFVSPSDVEGYLTIGRHAHEELFRRAADIPSELLHRVPAARRRSLSTNLTHVARAEMWYLTRIIDDPRLSGMPDALTLADQEIDATIAGVDQVRIAWEAFQRHVRSLPDHVRADVMTPTWFCTIRDERWTVRKALRRCLEHCREHTWVMERILREVAGSAER